jgi:hypothetical protein
MTTEDEAVAEAVAALKAIETATAEYQAAVRRATALGVKRGRLVAELRRSPEQIRQDGMTEEEREQVRAADAERKRKTREDAGKLRAEIGTSTRPRRVG